MQKPDLNSKQVKIAGAVLAAVLVLLCAVIFVKTRKSSEPEEEVIAEISSLTKEELAASKKEDALREIISEYQKFGIVETEGYINLRSEPDEVNMKTIIGRLDCGAGLDILETDGDWYRVSSGGIEGYCRSEYIVTGDKALELAEDNIADRAIINTDVLNIRSAPEIDSANVIGKARLGERYIYLGSDGDWAKISVDSEEGDLSVGYINVSDGNAEIRTCLNAARKRDLRTMALTQYDELVLAYTDGYINVRKEPKDDGINNIVGKFEKGNGAELLETVEGENGTWYRIKSGSVTGYVSAAYCLTGQQAKDAALDYAKLTAYVSVDSLNVRSDPSLDAKVWTQITKNQAYEVLDQLDGWVQIELDAGDSDDSDNAFVSTRDNNVEVRYGLGEAIEYYPAVEAANAAAAYRNKIVNFACKYVGNRYVWGGTSLTKGTDCSGFTMRVMEQFGISLPRTSREQAKVGTKVTSDRMKPGDLVFYANSRGTINHVAIYIGNGQVISAASRKSGIRITRWNYRSPVAIRNVIGS